VRKQAALLAAVVACLLAACGGSGTSTSAVASQPAPAQRANAVNPGTGGLKTVNVTSDGRRRSYLLYAPPGDSVSHPLPLVLVYHGVDSTAINTVSLTGLLSIAEQRHDMIVAFLQGYDESWNDDAGDPPAEAAGVNDVAFTTTVLHGVESDYPVDMTRVVATGLSNGAILTELLGCRIAANLTLIVPVEGQMAPRFSDTCVAAMPISVYEIHATGDKAIPYSGGTFAGVGGPVTVLSAPASAKRWAVLDHCEASGSNSPSGDSALTTYKACGESVTVSLESIQGGSHEWPPNFGDTLARVISSLAGERQAIMP
jgi:polyhydroxybutyrate depolymerase